MKERTLSSEKTVAVEILVIVMFFITILSFFLMLYFWEHGQVETGKVLIILFLLGTFFIFFFMIYQFDKSFSGELTFHRSILLYFINILLFTLIYFVGFMFTVSPAIKYCNDVRETENIEFHIPPYDNMKFIHGVASCEKMIYSNYSRDDPGKMYRSNVEIFFNHFYFSVISSTTVGYGEMHPTGPASRFINVLQHLFTFYIVFGLIASSRKKPPIKESDTLN